MTCAEKNIDNFLFIANSRILPFFNISVNMFLQIYYNCLWIMKQSLISKRKYQIMKKTIRHNSRKHN